MKFKNKSKGNSRRKMSKDIFDDGSDSIGDILFICLGAFILLFMIANFETSALQEKQLPDLKLSKFQNVRQGKTSLAGITLSVKKSKKGPVVYLDNRQVAVKYLESELKKLDGIAKVALRRENIDTKLEDQIIVAVTNAGISKLSIIVKNDSK